MKHLAPNFLLYAFILAASLVSPLSSLEAQSASSLSVDGPITSHMVLQRSVPIALSGKAKPGALVDIKFGVTETRTLANQEGTWSTSIRPHDANRNYTLRVSSEGEELKFDDIAVGEVWLCSGQSNMARPLSWVTGSEKIIAEEQPQEIRLLKLSDRFSPTPLDWESGQAHWVRASSKSVGSFSAACYFFGRELYDLLGVPIGLVSSSVGGSSIEAWTSLSGVAEFPEFASAIEAVEMWAADPSGEQLRFESAVDQWFLENDSGTQLGLQIGNSDNHDWKQIELPAPWANSDLSEFDGVAWYRLKIELPGSWSSKAATMHLGAVDDFDSVWLNGTPLGSTLGYNTPRSYQVPAGLLTSGVNEIAVRVLDFGGGGGFIGQPSEMFILRADGESINLAGPWLRRVTSSYSQNAPFPTSITNSYRSPSTIYNAMVHPLRKLRVGGVIWYQGEANAQHPNRYRSQLESWRKDWRNLFGEDLNFLVIQLPSYLPRKSDPARGNWPKIRFAQSQFAASNDDVGLVVTYDTGDTNDIHPQNKLEVGRRAAHVAFQEIYMNDFSHTVETIEYVTIDNHVRLTFFNSSKDAIPIFSRDGGDPLGMEWCEIERSCEEGSAKVEGLNLVVELPSVPSRSCLRHGWRDVPETNLMIGPLVPLGPFEKCF